MNEKGKLISIVIPCYNEEENVVAIASAIEQEMQTSLSCYDYEIIFIDNDSKDNTRPLLRELCGRRSRVRAILNAKNFGQFNSPYYGMCQANGDCVILMCCDFQDPVELLPTIVEKWEKGAKIVSCIKTASKENSVMRAFRSIYYKTIRQMSSVDQIEHFTGFGLYDKSFVDVLRSLKDPTPFLRGIVAELGFHRVNLSYTQAKRRAGHTHNNFFTLFDAAMLSFTSYTKVGVHLLTFIGILMAVVSLCIAVVMLVMKLIYWDRYVAGIAPMLVGLFFLHAIELLFIGFVGEYVMAINTRVMNRPLVIESERLNWPDAEQETTDVKE